MHKTKFKSAEEIEFSLRDCKRVALFSCAACANLCDVGGAKGIKFMKGLLKEWGKEVVVTKIVLTCCSEAIMKQAIRTHLKSTSGLDALVVLSCAAGVKSAWLCNPGVPVIAACDSVGTSVGWPRNESVDELVLHSICTACGHCVMTYTDGICPRSICPAKSLYGPCNKAPEEGTQCAVDPQRDCVWREMEKRGVDIEALRELKRIHEDESFERIPSLAWKYPSPAFLGRLVDRLVVRLPGPLTNVAHWIR